MSKTVNVRIAVAVDCSGAWNASGCPTASGNDIMELACEGVADGAARYWITAELVVPENREISGTVETAKA